MSAAWRILLVAVLLALLGWFAASQLRLDHRLDAFLPLPDSEEQAMLVDQIGSGPGSRMLLLALAGLDEDSLAMASRDLAAYWRDVPGVQRVENGEAELDQASMAALMQARFVLLDDVAQRLEAEAVAAQLEQRVAELAFGMGQFDTLIQRDPLGLLLSYAERLTPAGSPQSIDGVWFDRSGTRALLLIVTDLPPFETDAQQQLLARLQALPPPWSQQADLKLVMAGAPVMAVNSAQQARRDAQMLSMLGSSFLILVLLWAWRSPLAVMAAALPLGAGVIAGLLATLLLFDQVHALTLAFGFTLLGVALDYPVHLFAHSREQAMSRAVREIRRPLLLGVASTLIAYLAIAVSSSPGLAQLGVFSAAGLLVSALVTLMLPWLGLVLSPCNPPRCFRLPYQPLLPLGLAVLALMVLVVQGEQRWSLDLGRLSPMDPQLLAEDIALRGELGAGDVRYLIVVSDADLEQTLQDTERTVTALSQSPALISEWQAVTDLVPSQAMQARRLAQWPDAGQLGEILEQGSSRFRAGAFQPFLDDLNTVRQGSALAPTHWQDTALASRVDSLLSQGPWGWRSIIVPGGIDDPQALQQWLQAQQAPGRVVDLKAVTESMLGSYRQQVGTSLLLASLLIILLLAIRLGNALAVLRALAPPLAAMTCTAALFSVFDGGLTIVHLIGLLLAAGIGLDFALFSQGLSRDRFERARTAHAIGICALSSGGVFLILGQSSIGLLRMLGLTVATAIALSWLFTHLCQEKSETSS